MLRFGLRQSGKGIESVAVPHRRRRQVPRRVVREVGVGDLVVGVVNAKAQRRAVVATIVVRWHVDLRQVGVAVVDETQPPAGAARGGRGLGREQPVHLMVV